LLQKKVFESLGIKQELQRRRLQKKNYRARERGNMMLHS